MLVGPQHPGITKGIPMDFPSVGHGQNDLFAWQARAFLDQVAGLGKLAPVPSLAHGLHNMEILAAVTQLRPQRRPSRHPRLTRPATTP